LLALGGLDVDGLHVGGLHVGGLDVWNASVRAGLRVRARNRNAVAPSRQCLGNGALDGAEAGGYGTVYGDDRRCGQSYVVRREGLDRSPHQPGGHRHARPDPYTTLSAT
jgi:hypothetical protein